MGSGAERGCRPWGLDSDLWVGAREKEPAEELKTPKQEEKKLKNDHVRCWREELLNQRHIGAVHLKKTGASEVVKKSERGREQRSVWCVVYGEVMFKNRFGELQTAQWNLGRNKGYCLRKYNSSKSIGVPSCWCENHLRLQSFQLCCVLLGLMWFTTWEMWLIMAYSVPGGVVTAKPNKTRKRKRCIFIMGTVSKL